MSDELEHVDFGDKRLNRRLLRTAELMAECPAGSVNQSISDWAPKKGAYRLFSNSKFDANDVMKSHAIKTQERMQDRDVVLCLNDTTYMSYTGKDSIKGLGNIGGSKKNNGDDSGSGFLFHAALALTPEGTPLGIQSFTTWSRSQKKIWDKESKRWQDSYFEAKSLYSKNCQMVYVGDREADQFELMKAISEGQDSFVIRSRIDRYIQGPNSYLSWEIARESKELQGRYECPHTKKQIPVNVRYGSASFNDPEVSRAKHLNRSDIDSVSVNYVQIEQLEAGKRWLLLTNLEVQDLDSAMRVMNYYRHRWQIEEFFKVLKGGGLQVEKSALRSIDRLVNHLSLATVISWKIHYLQKAAREDEQALACEHLRLSEIEALELANKDKKLGAVNTWTLSYAIKFIAQMGGFNIREGKVPGLKTLSIGMVKLVVKADTVDDMKSALGLSPDDVLKLQ
ncbi:MAG: IS4 family transposase [Bacteriovoracaceae bacterium]